MLETGPFASLDTGCGDGVKPVSGCPHQLMVGGRESLRNIEKRPPSPSPVCLPNQGRSLYCSLLGFILSSFLSCQPGAVLSASVVGILAAAVPERGGQRVETIWGWELSGRGPVRCTQAQQILEQQSLLSRLCRFQLRRPKGPKEVAESSHTPWRAVAKQPKMQRSRALSEATCLLPCSRGSVRSWLP